MSSGGKVLVKVSTGPRRGLRLPHIKSDCSRPLPCTGEGDSLVPSAARVGGTTGPAARLLFSPLVLDQQNFVICVRVLPRKHCILAFDDSSVE